MKAPLLAMAILAISTPAMAQDHGHDGHVAEAGGLSAIHAWTNATTARNALVYVDIENDTDATVELTGGHAEIAGTVELVALDNANGQLRFEVIPRLPVPPQGHVALEPNAIALRLSKLAAPLEQGATFPIALTFGDIHMDVIVEIESSDATQHSHAGHAH